MVSQLDDTTFDQEIDASPLPVVVQFFATGCGNCRRIAPTLQALVAQFAMTVRFVRVDADDNPKLVARFGIRSTPTLVVLRDRRPAARLVGAHPEPVLRELFLLAADTAQPGGGATWVPTDACTLTTAQQPARLAEFDALFTSALRATNRVGDRHLQLRLVGGDGVLDRARDLAERESACCTFFDFDVTRAGEEILVDVRVPADRTAVLDGLDQQARLAHG